MVKFLTCYVLKQGCKFIRNLISVSLLWKAYSSQNIHSPEVTSKAISPDEELDDSVKTLREKLASALHNIRAKDDLVKQHSKVAEEAVSGNNYFSPFRISYANWLELECFVFVCLSCINTCKTINKFVLVYPIINEEKPVSEPGNWSEMVLHLIFPSSVESYMHPIQAYAAYLFTYIKGFHVLVCTSATD